MRGMPYIMTFIQPPPCIGMEFIFCVRNWLKIVVTRQSTGMSHSMEEKLLPLGVASRSRPKKLKPWLKKAMLLISPPLKIPVR